MDIQELRNQIDQVDDELVCLYIRRMELIRKVGCFKREHGIPVSDPEREKNLLNRVREKAGGVYEEEIQAFFGFLLSQSKNRQIMDGNPESRS